MTSTPPVFIGCACDRGYVEPTAVMLSSVDLNAGLPDAVVIVAGFDLEKPDQAVLRAGAGRLGQRLRFIDIRPDSMPVEIAARFTTGHASMLGRLFLPSQIGVRGARLITLDSDMIVNAELKTLIELDLGGRVCAAVQDLTRPDDPCAFDANLTVVDVDEYNRRHVAVRCIRWLSKTDIDSRRPDQDALNAVVGDDWLELESRWTFYEQHASTTDYESSAVAHFKGHPKPWDHAQHPGAPLYKRHQTNLKEKLERRTSHHSCSGRDLLATCYEVLLGRELEHGPVIRERETWPAAQIVRSIVESSEFQSNVLLPLQQDVPFPEGLFPGGPTMRQRFWAADQLPVSGTFAAQIRSAPDWRDFLVVLLSDTAFSEAMALPYLPLLGHEDDRSRHRAAIAG